MEGHNFSFDYASKSVRGMLWPGQKPRMKGLLHPGRHQLFIRWETLSTSKITIQGIVSFVLCVPIHYIAFCPVDSVIHPMNNWIQWAKSLVYPDYSSVAKSNSKKLLIKYLSVPLLFLRVHHYTYFFFTF